MFLQVSAVRTLVNCFWGWAGWVGWVGEGERRRDQDNVLGVCG